ncbi:MAG: peptidylprolyl isomerase [Acidobacteria bacterium]|nr:peptidylprolyl isomerase [Acidobacteriota bacterium]
MIYAASTVLLAAPSFGQDTPPRVALETNHGTIVLELNPEKAPITVENFLDYVERGWYDGTVFHRVIDGFMIQGGGFTPDLQRKITRPEIENESKNGLSNKRGTIAMARTGDPHSATAQFFINLVDNDGLDASGSSWGYAVFGEVVEGIEVIDSIAKVEVKPGRVSEAEPQETVSLVSAKKVQ